MLTINDKRCYKCLKEILPLDAIHYGVHLFCFQTWFQDAIESFSGIERPVFKSLALKSQEDPFINPILSSNYQGKYKKYSATLGNIHYILKVEEPAYPELPAVEYLCNQIAELLKIPVSPYYLLRFENEGNIFSAFVVKDFMQDLFGADFVHIYRYLKKTPEIFDEYNCEAILSAIMNNTHKKKDIKTFIEMCMFDALIGNHDRHGRNLGLIQRSIGKSLAPIYDNPSYIAIEEDFLESDLNPTGKIATQLTNEPTMKDYIIEFRRLGFQKQIEIFKKRVNIKKIFHMVDNALLSQKRKQAIKRLMTKRYHELMNE